MNRLIIIDPTNQTETSITFHGTFKAGRAYVWPLGVLLGAVMTLFVYLFFSHHWGSMVITAVFAAILWVVLVLTLRIQVTVGPDGIGQQGLSGQRTVRWNEIVRVQHTARSCEIYDDQKEILNLSLIDPTVRKAILTEIISQADLKKSSAKTIFPVLEVWER